MCIAVWKNVGVKMPKKEVLRKCFNSNSQGAGFAHYDPDKEVWIVQKGFMSWKKFWAALRFMQYQKKDAVIMHFRISTSGKRTHPDCTHPFPVSFEIDELNAHTYEATQIVMHNGVVGPGDGDLSDTQVAIMEHVTPLFPHIDERGIESILGDLLKDDRCRWFIADKTSISLYGEWHDGEEHAPGVLFSNKGFIPYVAPVNQATNQRHCGRWNAANNDNQNHAAGRATAPNPFHQTTGLRNTSTGTSPGVEPVVYKDTIIVNLGNEEDKSDFIAENGGWDWKLWEDESRFSENKGNEKKVIKFPSMLIHAPSLVEVYDLDNKLDAVVDDHGNIMWEDGEWVEVKEELSGQTLELAFEIKKEIVEEGVDWEFPCPGCGNLVTVRKLSYNGECCFCYAEILSWEEIDWIDSAEGNTGSPSHSHIECPNCHESKALVDTPYNVGDTMCNTCGAVFLDNTDEIVMYDMDLARSYKIAQAVMGA